MSHFELQIIPPTHWHRIRETFPRGRVNARPHLVPLTEEAERFIQSDGYTHNTGLVISKIKGGYAYRFIRLDESVAAELIESLNQKVDNV